MWDRQNQIFLFGVESGSGSRGWFVLATPLEWKRARFSILFFIVYSLWQPKAQNRYWKTAALTGEEFKTLSEYFRVAFKKDALDFWFEATALTAQLFLELNQKIIKFNFKVYSQRHFVYSVWFVLPLDFKRFCLSIYLNAPFLMPFQSSHQLPFNSCV